MNILDRAIAWVSPSAGRRRMQSRLAIKHLSRAYEGAKQGRRTDGWVAGGTSANAEIGAALVMTRNRARDLVRNNPYADKGVEVIDTNAVGTGIIAKSAAKNKKNAAKIDAAWADWVAGCDADGINDLYGLQSLVTRAIVESGECLVRFRNRRPEDGLAVPLQIQVLEGDYLDTAKNGPVDANLIIQGIEFNPIGQRVAYWLFTQHPGDTYSALLQRGFMSVRVPASEILHLYRVDRPGQIRGITWLAPALLKMRDLDDYDDAELMRKKIAACLAAFVTTESGEDGPSIGVPSTDSSGKKIDGFEPGMVEYLRPGESVTINNPQDGGNFDGYSKTQLRAVAAGIGTTYEDLTGDLSNVNYSSYRAGQLQFRRTIEKYRWQLLIPRFCQQVRNRFIDTAFIAGVIDKPDYATKWTAPRFESIDPAKEAKGNLLAMRSGEVTLPQVVGSNGYDIDEQLAEIAATNKKLDELGIVLDSDPRRVSQTGQAASVGSTGDTQNDGTAQD